jgi:hypothetical protein
MIIAFCLSLSLNSLHAKDGFHTRSGELFTAAHAINTDTSLVYVRSYGNDGTAVIGDANKPYLTIAGATAAGSAATYIIVDIGSGRFATPANTQMRKNIWYRGNGQGSYNYTSTVTADGIETFTVPTAITGGTTLVGPWISVGNANVKVSNLGLDVGASVCNALYGGVAQEGLLFVQCYTTALCGTSHAADGIHGKQTSSPPTSGIIVDNVSILCKDAASAVHACVFENVIDPVVSNIKTIYGTHGVVVKSIRGVFNNVICRSHQTNGLIIKANDYAFCNTPTISNISIGSLAYGEGGGINIVCERDTVRRFKLTAFTVVGCSFGLKTTLNTSGSIQDVNISDGIIARCTGNGIDISGTPFVNSSLSNINISGCGGIGLYLSPVTGYVKVSNIISVYNIGGGYYLSSPTRIDAMDLYADGNGGTGVAYNSNVFTIAITNTGITTGSSIAR